MNASVAIPALPAARWRMSWWTILLILVAVAGGVALVWFRPWNSGSSVSAVEKFYTVQKMDMDIRISVRGELQAVKYVDVVNQVEGSNQITWLMKEGERVEKGTVICKLDSSTLEQRKEQLDLDLRKAKSNVDIAKEMLQIQSMQNDTNEEAAKVGKQLAELELKQYLEGTYKQQLENAKVALEMSRILLKNREEDYEQTKTLFAKGFVMAADVKKGELDVTNQRNEVQKAETALRVLQEYSHPMERKRLESNLAQADQRLARTLRQSKSYLVQSQADLDEKEAALRMLRDRSEKLAKQIAACTIAAPEAGEIIYMSSIERWNPSAIQEGAQVRQNQILIRLPDVRQMKVVCRTTESQKLKLKENEHRAMVKIAGVPNQIGSLLTRVAPLPDTSQRWNNPDAKEYPIELTLDETPPGLRLNTGAEVDILVQHLERTLAVPVSAIYMTGDDAYVFLHEDNALKPRKVKLGASNDTHVQIVDGVNESEEVLILQAGQGRELLQKAGVKLDEPTTRPDWGAGKRRPDRARNGEGPNGKGGAPQVVPAPGPRAQNPAPSAPPAKGV